MAGNTPQEMISAALDKWRKTLVSFDGNNRQIYYRKKKLADISFEDDLLSPEALENLLSESKIRVSNLYPDLVKKIETKDAKSDLSLDDALDELDEETADPAKQWAQRLRRFEAVYRKTREDEEERNIQTCFIAEGFATWQPKQNGTVTPNAPLILHPIKMAAVSKGNSDFSLQKTGPAVLNEALTLFLETECGVPASIFNIQGDALRIDSPEIIELINSIKEYVPGFRVKKELLLGNFAFLLYPMVIDLQRIIQMSTEHPVLSLLSGVPSASSVMEAIGLEEELEQLSIKNPIIENLVFPADASQHAAISAIMGGKNIVIQGPPGTGKSQTIANVIAECAANKKSVLFVAEKRAAIDAVVERLGQKGLQGIVLDLHGEPDKKTIAKNLTEVLKSYNVSKEPSNASIDKLLKAKKLLQKRWEWITQPTKVTNSSGIPLKAHELFRELGIRAAALDRSVFSYAITYIPDIESIDTSTRDALSERFDLLYRCDYFGNRSSHELANNLLNSFFNEGDALQFVEKILALNSIASTREVQSAYPLAQKLLNGTQDSVNEIHKTLKAYSEVIESVSVWKMEEYEVITSNLLLLEGAKAYRQAKGLGWWEGRRLRKADFANLVNFRLDTSVNLSPKELLTGIQLLKNVVTNWTSIGGQIDNLQHRDASVGVYADAISKVLAITSFLNKYPGFSGLESQPASEIAKLGSEIQKDLQYVRDIPKISEALSVVRQHGLTGIVDFFEENRINYGQISDYWEYLWFDAHVRKLIITTGESGFNSANLNDAIREFRDRDIELFNSNPGKIIRNITNALLQMDTQESQLLKKESFKKSGHLPFRELFSKIPKEIQAIKPCFAMSPLAVSRLLPCKEGLFDLVIFDEASQIKPENAITTIFRGKQLAVAGDRYQLPPTKVGMGSKSRNSETSDSDDIENPTGELDDMESILDTLLALYPNSQCKPLTLHYRSNDERLISWSNYYIYREAGQELASFPSTESDEYKVLRHNYIPNVRTQNMSRANEVEIAEVVKAVKKHIREHPEMSLGIIAFGSRHSIRLQDTFNVLEREDSAFYAWKSSWEEKKDRFFIKNIERVQGDERDAIIISPGYAPNLEGSVSLNFGTLNNEGGERRLNVAASRARKYMHVITSLKSTEIDLGRTSKRSVALFKSFLAFMENEGRLAELPQGFGRPESPFEEEVLAALEKKGLLVDCQVGESKYKLDFAIRDPETNRYIIAVEADGATYHQQPYARERDWLRQDILEKKGWTFVRIWSTDWWENPAYQVTRVIEAYEKARLELRAPKSTLAAEVAIPAVDIERDLNENNEYQVLRGLLAQFPKYSRDELMAKWMTALTLKRRTPNMVERFDIYLRQAKKDIS
jgi:very-short-patch-repair endonuclease